MLFIFILELMAAQEPNDDKNKNKPVETEQEPLPQECNEEQHTPPISDSEDGPIHYAPPELPPSPKPRRFKKFTPETENSLRQQLEEKRDRMRWQCSGARIPEIYITRSGRKAKRRRLFSPGHLPAHELEEAIETLEDIERNPDYSHSEEEEAGPEVLPTPEEELEEKKEIQEFCKDVIDKDKDYEPSNTDEESEEEKSEESDEENEEDETELKKEVDELVASSILDEHGKRVWQVDESQEAVVAEEERELLENVGLEEVNDEDIPPPPKLVRQNAFYIPQKEDGSDRE